MRSGSGYRSYVGAGNLSKVNHMIYYTPIDFAIVCALDEELSALLQVFGIERESRRWIGSLQTWSTIFKNKHIRIVDLENRQGVLNASVAAAELLHAWAPWCIVSFGIAGRALKDDEEIRLRDVVVATCVDYYEPGKETDSKKGAAGFLMDMRPFPTEASFLQHLHLANQSCEGVWVKPGSIMSGEKKIAGEKNRVKKIISVAKRKTFAIEMEAAGVGGAVERFNRVGAGAVKFLVVKGLSDNAGFDESAAGRKRSSKATTERANTRTQAAINAARALAAIAEATGRTGETSTDAHVRAVQIKSTADRMVTSLLPILDLEKTSAALGTAVDDVLPKDVVKVAVSNLIRRAKMTPPLFVHWRIKPDFHPLHWLDFATMLRIRRATNGANGVPNHVLLSDEDQISKTARQKVESMIKRVMPDDTRITWHSEAQHLVPLIDTYIANLGLSAEFASVPTDITQRPEHFWMKYIIWATDRIGSCFLLPWRQKFPIWNLLFKVYSRQVIILYRSTIFLGNEPAKEKEPGRSILISPPNYEQLINCIRTQPDNVLADLVRHLWLDDEDLSQVEGKESLVQTHRKLKQAADPNGPAYRLLLLMDHWNSVYFVPKS